MHPALLYVPGRRLALPELCAARMDGHLVEIGDAYIPADLVEGTTTRAATLAGVIPASTAASGPTAAWVHGAGDAPPPRHHVSRAVPRRIRAVHSSRIVVHHSAVPEEDVETIAGIAVTTPLRTMTDLALGLHRDPTLRDWMTSLAAVDGDLVARTVTALDALHRVPGTVSGRAALLRIRTT
ncbi:type IV toxin-antitoxin system AbiEi family antitoxin [Microbacterium sp. NPDC089695]|uniref:type IV toxin-antitoxin system AbiEi family antitoxin n=1 Tax=Microbacterium sp. NPDC089695 TaxID=3364198 RepID=UPI00381C0270